MLLGCTLGQVICVADEMRLGLHSQLRRVWYKSGCALRQRQQMRFEWQWLYLGVDVLSGQLRWLWQANLRKESMAEALTQWRREGVDAVIWDNASVHKAKALRALEDAAPARAFLPPYSPELSPAERLFEEVRRHVEGRLYASLDDKRQAAEAFLKQLAKDKERVKSIAGWQWIQEALNSLPEPTTNAA